MSTETEPLSVSQSSNPFPWKLTPPPPSLPLPQIDDSRGDLGLRSSRGGRGREGAMIQLFFINWIEFFISAPRSCTGPWTTLCIALQRDVGPWRRKIHIGGWMDGVLWVAMQCSVTCISRAIGTRTQNEQANVVVRWMKGRRGMILRWSYHQGREMDLGLPLLCLTLYLSRS